MYGKYYVYNHRYAYAVHTANLSETVLHNVLNISLDTLFHKNYL